MFAYLLLSRLAAALALVGALALWIAIDQGMSVFDTVAAFGLAGVGGVWSSLVDFAAFRQHLLAAVNGKTQQPTNDGKLLVLLHAVGWTVVGAFVAHLQSEPPAAGLFLAILALIFFGFRRFRAPYDGDIQTFDRFRWSWKAGLKGMLKGVLLGTCFGIIVLFVDYFGDGELIGWAIAGDHVRKRIAVVMVMCYFVALPFTLFFAMFSLFSALWYGGLDALRHYLLRLLAVWLGYMPRRCAHFLEYCSKLVFLRRVGGGYIFIHRMLLEHLAAMWEGEDKERGQGASIRSSSAIAAPT